MLKSRASPCWVGSRSWILLVTVITAVQITRSVPTVLNIFVNFFLLIVVLNNLVVFFIPWFVPSRSYMCLFLWLRSLFMSSCLIMDFWLLGLVLFLVELTFRPLFERLFWYLSFASSRWGRFFLHFLRWFDIFRSRRPLVSETIGFFSDNESLIKLFFLHDSFFSFRGTFLFLLLVEFLQHFIPNIEDLQDLLPDSNCSLSRRRVSIKCNGILDHMIQVKLQSIQTMIIVVFYSLLNRAQTNSTFYHLSVNLKHLKIHIILENLMILDSLANVFYLIKQFSLILLWLVVIDIVNLGNCFANVPYVTSFLWLFTHVSKSLTIGTTNFYLLPYRFREAIFHRTDFNNLVFLTINVNSLIFGQTLKTLVILNVSVYLLSQKVVIFTIDWAWTRDKKYPKVSPFKIFFVLFILKDNLKINQHINMLLFIRPRPPPICIGKNISRRIEREKVSDVFDFTQGSL